MSEWSTITSDENRKWFQSPHARSIHVGYHHFFLSPKRKRPMQPPTVSNVQIEYPVEFLAWADNSGESNSFDAYDQKL